MLDSWNEMIFNVIKERLQTISMDLVYSERIGNMVDSRLVIGVRQSYGLCRGMGQNYGGCMGLGVRQSYG